MAPRDLAALFWSAVLGSAVLVGCGDAAEQATAARRPAPQAVRVTSVREGPVRDVIRYAGTLSAEREVQVVAQVGGTVAAVKADEGQRVQRGQLLVRIRAPELSARVERVTAEATRARAEGEHACRTFETDQTLARGGHVAEDRVRFSRKGCDAATAAHEAAEAAGREARATGSRTVERAPFTARVLRRFAESGQTVGPGHPLLVLAGEEREVKLRASERDLLRGLKVGARALVDLGAGGVIERSVTRVSPAASADTRSIEVGVALEPTDAPDLPVGTTSDVAVVLSAVENASAVPSSSLRHEGGKAHVLVVDGDRLRLVEVTPGLVEEGWVSIDPRLPSGARVVTRGVMAVDAERPIFIVEDDQTS